jgi:type II secretory pathway component PulJ
MTHNRRRSTHGSRTTAPSSLARQWQRARCAGFTLVEATVVSALMTVLAVVLSSAWAGLGRPAVNVIARARLLAQMNLAVDCLARDLGGSLGDAAGRLGGKQQAAFVGWLLPGNGQLWLCFDGGAAPNGLPDWAPPDNVVVYMLQGGSLVRWNQSSDTTFTVARNAAAMDLSLAGGQLRIQLTFQFRDVARTCTFIASPP